MPVGVGGWGREASAYPIMLGPWNATMYNSNKSV
jgi:hypothetical protein